MIVRHSHSQTMNQVVRIASGVGKAVILATILLGAFPAFAVPAIQTYLQLGTIDGEAEVKEHKGEIEVIAFSSGVFRSLESGGTAYSKPQFLEFQVSKNVDRSSPLLFVNCAIGKHFPTAVITVTKLIGDKPVDFFKVTLTDVLITSVHSTGTDGKSGSLTESVTLAFSTIRWTYTIVNDKGDSKREFSGGFDLKTNKPL